MVHFVLYNAVPPPNVSISSEGSGMFGEPYNLTCTVELADISIPRAGIVTFIEWFVDAFGGVYLSQEPDLEGTITSRTLSFSFLSAFNDGVYVCYVAFIDSSELFLLPGEIQLVESITG